MAAIGMMLIGVIITGFSPVITIFIGMMVFTAGFFAAHSVASSWIGRRARRAKAQASSLYLFCYYAGSSVAGTLGGIFWLNLGGPVLWHLSPRSCCWHCMLGSGYGNCQKRPKSNLR